MATDTAPTTSAAAAAAGDHAHSSTRRERAARIAAAIGAATREFRLPVVHTDATRVAEIALRSQQSYLAFLAEVLIPTLRTESHVAAATGGWLRSCRPWTHGAGLATSKMRVVAASIIIPLRLAAPSARASASPTADTTAVAWSISVWEGPL